MEPNNKHKTTIITLSSTSPFVPSARVFKNDCEALAKQLKLQLGRAHVGKRDPKDFMGARTLTIALCGRDGPSADIQTEAVTSFAKSRGLELKSLTVVDSSDTPKQASGVHAYYSRMSRRGDDESIKRQQEACIEYARRRGWNIEQHHTDQGGGNDGLTRPALAALLQSASAGAVRTLIVESPDRLSRDYAASAVIFESLTTSGVELHSAVHGKLQRMAIGARLAVEDRRVRGARISAGRRAAAERRRLLRESMPDATSVDKVETQEARPKVLEGRLKLSRTKKSQIRS